MMTTASALRSARLGVDERSRSGIDLPPSKTACPPSRYKRFGQQRGSLFRAYIFYLRLMTAKAPNPCDDILIAKPDACASAPFYPDRP